MASIKTEAGLVSAVHSGIQMAADGLREDYIQKTVAAFEKELRARVAQIAVNVSNFYSIETFGQDLRITVRWNEEKANAQ